MPKKPLPIEDTPRWCFMGDVHGKANAFIDVCRHADSEGISVLISVGDFGYFPGSQRGDEFLAMVVGQLEIYKLYLVLVDGNHDNHKVLRGLELDESGMGVMGPRARYAPRGHAWMMRGVRFLAAGGAASVDRGRRLEGVSWWREEVLSFEETNRCLDAGRCDVVISHDCPQGIERVFFVGRPDEAAIANRDALQAIVESAHPKVLVHGHYHQRYDALLELGSGDLVEVVGLGKNGDGRDLYFDLSAEEVLGTLG